MFKKRKTTSAKSGILWKRKASHQRLQTGDAFIEIQRVLCHDANLWYTHEQEGQTRLC